MHLGEGTWVVVDSCVDSVTNRATPLDYLKSIGIDTASAVRQVVATHWHDDHIRGLAELLEDCSQADFVCSDALREGEFVQLVCAYRGVTSTYTSSGVDEFGRIMEVLEGTGRSPRFASADQRLHKACVAVRGEQRSCELWSLSPTSFSCFQSKASIKGLLPKGGSGAVRRLPAPETNETCVVLWASVGPLNILLGSDLPAGGHDKTGWCGILASETRPQGKAQLLKVPHHGAASGWEPRMWTELLLPNPIAAVTPWRRGNRRLPSNADVARILTKTEKAYITAASWPRTPIKRSPPVNRTLKEVTRQMHRVLPEMGHIRVRFNLLTEETGIDLFGGATSMQ